MKKCRECGTILPCVNNRGICKECDEQFQFCFAKCKNPCIDKDEQKKMFDKLKDGWNNR